VALLPVITGTDPVPDRVRALVTESAKRTATSDIKRETIRVETML